MKKLFGFLIKFFAFIVVLSVVFSGAAYCGYLYITPSSVISLKGSPSIRYSVNSFNRVIKVETDESNIEISSMIEDLKLNNKNISDAVQKTLEEISTGGYVSQYNNSGFVLSISGTDEKKANAMMEKLKKDVQIYLDGKSEVENVKIETAVNVTQNSKE
nr:hypothetical protein [Sedimentibacter sp.]